MVPWKKTLTIPSLRKNDHRTGLHVNIIFDTSEQSSFQKYTTCWVFLALCNMLYLCICMFVYLCIYLLYLYIYVFVYLCVSICVLTPSYFLYAASHLFQRVKNDFAELILSNAQL